MEEMGLSGANPDAGFWSRKRVLLTGHTGFKGSWLSIWLQSLGAEVCGFSLSPSTGQNLFDVANVAEGMRSEIGDIRDLGALDAIMASFQPEIVLHLAAQPLVRRSYVDPIETYSTNVMGTVNVLEAIKRIGTVKAVLNVTTDKCYENREWIWSYRETEPMGGFDPYSSSKGCSELVTAAYRQSFYTERGIALASARAGNVVGGGDWSADRLIPDTLRAIERGETVLVRSPTAIRPWQHVLEPLAGYLLLAEKLYIEGPLWAEGWNLGPNDEDAKPVSWVVEQLVALSGHKPGWCVDRAQHPHEAHYLKLDISKIRARLGWTPRWRLELALEHIVNWQKAFVAGRDMRDVCTEQIAHYISS